MNALAIRSADPPPFHKSELLGLKKYDAMLVAIAACQKVDEVKSIRDVSDALEKYAKAAKNFEAELRAMSIRIRASRRAGELLAEMGKNGQRQKRGSTGRNHKSNASTLEDFGITKDQSSQWQQLAGVSEELIEKADPVATRERTTIETIIRESKPKPNPAQLRKQKLASIALNIWGRVRDIAQLAEDESLPDLVAAMDAQILNDLKKSIPQAWRFLSKLEKEIRNAQNK